MELEKMPNSSSSPNNKILDLTKFKDLHTSNGAYMIIFVFCRVENIVGKGENADYFFVSIILHTSRLQSCISSYSFYYYHFPQIFLIQNCTTGYIIFRIYMRAK